MGSISRFLLDFWLSLRVRLAPFQHSYESLGGHPQAMLECTWPVLNFRTRGHYLNDRLDSHVPIAERVGTTR